MSNYLYSWGRYPRRPQTPHLCSWRDELSNQFDRVASISGTTLAYGNGRSYGDSCLALSSQVFHLKALNKFIHVDWQLGIVIAEPGLTLGEILEVSIPRGWFLAVTPGTQFVSLGGAVANDVHGKNHHRRGTFGKHVSRFGLLRHGQDEIVCSASENAELYSATIGGLGLTGIISWVEIKLVPVRTSLIDSTSVRFGNLSEFFQLSDELDSLHEYSVAWIDCLAKSNQLGRGVYFVGNHADYGALDFDIKPKLNVPFIPPISLINNLSLKLFNEAYWRAHSRQKTHSQVGYDPFFYPLDRISNWNRIYGKPGFQQYQCVIPTKSAEIAVRSLLQAIAIAGAGSFLVVLKRCGDIISPGLLSFPIPGISLALDFPQNLKLSELFTKLDAIVSEAGGRLYPAKDAHMSGSDFRKAYPNWETLELLRDPSLMSLFWKRVTS